MAENNAARELERLLNMQAAGAAAQNNARRTMDARTAPGVIDMARQLGGSEEAPKAPLSLPEGLVTGVGAGILFGPLVGVALGSAQAIMGRQAKQSALDTIAAENAGLNESNAVIDAEFDRLEAEAGTEENLRQVRTMRAQMEVAQGYTANASPRLQEMGAALAQKTWEDMTRYQEENEAQQIAADAATALAKKELGEERWSKYTENLADFDSESAPYLSIMDATNLALEALKDGDPADLWAAGLLVNKALDPSSIVRPDEAAAVGQLAGMWDKVKAQLSGAADGENILPEQREDLRETLTMIQDNATRTQQGREAKFLERAIIADLPNEMLDSFRLTDRTPRVAPFTIEGVNPEVSELAGDLANSIPAVRDTSRGVLNTLRLMNPFGFFDENPNQSRVGDANRISEQTGVVERRRRPTSGGR